MEHNTIRWLCFFLIFTLIMGCAPINQSSSPMETGNANHATATETLTPTPGITAIESSGGTPVALTPEVTDTVSPRTNPQPGSQETLQATASATETRFEPILVFDSTIAETFRDTSWTTHLRAEAPLTCELTEGEFLCWAAAPLQVIDFQATNGEELEITGQPEISGNIGFQIILSAHPENIDSDKPEIKLSIIIPNVKADAKLALFSGLSAAPQTFPVWSYAFEQERLLDPPIPFGKGQAVLTPFTKWVYVGEPGNPLIAYTEESRKGPIPVFQTYQEITRIELRVK